MSGIPCVPWNHRWIRNLAARGHWQAAGVWDVSERERCSLRFTPAGLRPENVPVPFPVSQGGHSSGRNALSGCWEPSLLGKKMDLSAHSPRLECPAGPWSSPGHWAERGKLCRPPVCFSRPSLECFFLFPSVPLPRPKGVFPVHLCLPGAAGQAGMGVWQMLQMPAVNSLLLQPHCSPFPQREGKHQGAVYVERQGNEAAL